MCQESWKLLSLRNKYSLGKDLAKPVFAFQTWWENTEKRWGWSSRPCRFTQTHFKLENLVCVKYCCGRTCRQLELIINLNLSVLLPTNSKALKHLLMCLSLGDQSLGLLFVSSFLCLMYAFVNHPLLIIENNAILLLLLWKVKQWKKPLWRQGLCYLNPQ